MPLRLTIFIAAALCLATTSAADSVRLRANATVNGGFVHLGDIADITASDDEIRFRMEDIVVAPAPMPGSRISLRVDRIQSRLSSFGFTPATIDYRGSSVVTVLRQRKEPEQKIQTASYQPAQPRRLTSSSRQRRQAEDIVHAVVGDYLAQNAPEWGQPRIEPELLDTQVEPINLVGHDLTIQSGRQLRPGLFLLALTDERDAAVEPVVRVRVRIEQRPRVYAVRHAVAAGQIIRQSDLQLVEVDDADRGVASTDEIVGMQAKRAIKAGTPVVATLVEPALLVKSRDIVAVHAGLGGIRITRQLRATRSGALGDVITFEDPTDRTVRLTARVTGLRTAEVLSAGSAQRN